MYSGCKTHRVDGEGTAALNIERDRQGNEMRVSLRTFFTCSILLGMVTLAQTTISPINSQGSMGFQAFASPSPSYSNHIVFIILENHPLSSVTVMAVLMAEQTMSRIIIRLSTSVTS